MIEEALVARLKNDGTVSAIVGTSVFSAPAPERATLPFVVWQLIGDGSFRVAAGTTNFRSARFQVTVWSSTRATAIDGATAVRNCLDSWVGSGIHVAQVTSETDLYDNGFNPARHGRALDLEVTYKEG